MAGEGGNNIVERPNIEISKTEKKQKTEKTTIEIVDTLLNKYIELTKKENETEKNK